MIGWTGVKGKMKRLTIGLLILLGAMLPAVTAQAAYIGKVVDAQTKEPVVGALATLGAEVARTGKDGGFRLEAAARP